jgi:uncharacterized protein YsxB (DUF464 family)
MTTVVFERDGDRYEVRASGHAGNRDVCVGTTFALRTFAHMLEAVGYEIAMRQREEQPFFAVAWTAQGNPSRLMRDEIAWILERLAEQYPGHLQIERRDAVRHDGERIRQSA